ncbi:O-antigen ligase family protein [Candidatus Saccharibacteria bacterium]|nr:O-antigen ligase family protein [Candidatus Saccharibacteria bacterium]
MKRVYRFLIYILPVVLFFSYQPLVHFAANESMNFEISLPLIWLVLFDVLVVVMGWRKRGLWRGILKRWVWLLLPIWLSLSVLWSLNSLRGLLTVGIVWLVYLAVYGFFEFRELFREVGFKEKFWKVFFGSTLVICLWCWLQCVLDLMGVGQEYTLMCDGCTYQMFGFPHPNGFAIEPQFMGNLLLAPAIVIAWTILKDDHNSIFRGRGSSRPSLRGSDPSFLGRNLRKPLKILLLVILVSTLFLTFSRGAIYAFIVAMIVMTVWWVVQGRKWKVLSVWLAIILSFVFTLNIQGLMAEVSPTRDTYATGVAKVLNHLSLGVIDVREPGNNELTEVEVVENPVENFVGGNQSGIDVESQSNEVNDAIEQEAAFDGYVAESTDTRLRLSSAAFEIWRQDFGTAMFGVGLGGAGQALYVNGLSPAPKEIVQNQYVSLLLETGIVGVGLTIFSLVLVVRAIWRSPWRVMLLSLLVAYGITLLFFSGLPNALHIYLLPAVIYSISLRKKLVS